MARVTLAGQAFDILTNAGIMDVHVYQTTGSGTIGTTTDATGMYVLEVEAGLPVTLSHVAYETETYTPPATLAAVDAVVHYLVPAAYELPEVEIFPDGPIRPDEPTPPPTTPPQPQPPTTTTTPTRRFPWGWAALAAVVGYVATRR